MRSIATAAIFALAVAVAGCTDDPHPASGSTPGDPGHPGSASIYNDEPAPMTPPGSSGTGATEVPLGTPYNTNGPPGTLNGYGDPTTSEPSK